MKIGSSKTSPIASSSRRDEAEVVARPDLLLVDVGVVVDEEVERRRQHDEVAERDSDREQHGREHDEDRDDALGVLLHGRREKAQTW